VNSRIQAALIGGAAYVIVDYFCSRLHCRLPDDATKLTDKDRRKLAMTDQRPKIAALVADAFQEEEYFFP
jgi:hypothetical protein